MNWHHHFVYGQHHGLLVLVVLIAVIVLAVSSAVDGPARRIAGAVILLALVMMLCGGCADLPREELAWQLVHAADVAQTVQGPVRRPDCYREANPITEPIIGAHPSMAGAIGWGIGLAAIHAEVAALLQAHVPKLATAWEYVTITEAGIAVHSNTTKGVRPWGADACHT